MENRVINESNQRGAMFFCYVKVSERLERTMDSEERRLAEWCRHELGNRVLTDGTLWEQTVLAIGERVAELNRGRIGYGPYFHLDAMAPTDLSMGFIRISRVHARHQCIHISVGHCNGYVSMQPEAPARDRLS
ncbi:MAG: hypothetical protein IJ253_02550 [Bacteroidaceae bacterium]|nr:hypothetical protein [Bacteroidaceae bacterium]